MNSLQHRLVSFAPVCLLFVSAASAQTSAPTLDAEQSAFVTLINNYRVANGAGTLQVSLALQNSSQWMSADMAAKNYFSHTDSLGRDPFTRMRAFNYAYAPAGENIAAGYSDAQNTFTQWVNACDPDASGACTYAHRVNMLNPGFRVIGVGRAYNAAATYRWYWTTDFGGVVDQTIGSTPTADTLPPTVPTLAGTATSPTSVKLSWNPSTDNVGVTGYQITRNGAVLGTVSGTAASYTDSTAAASATYSYTIRAYDAAGNYSGASNTVLVATPAGSATAPATSNIWAANVLPVYTWVTVSSPIELGIKFRSDVNGKIAGIRFYKGLNETGGHTGSLWSATGTLLATGAFVNESASGWQTLKFATPVSIAANTTYIASYHANQSLAADFGSLASRGVDLPPLHALQTGVSGPNGVYAYGASRIFPAYGSNGDNYWVDVLFAR